MLSADVVNVALFSDTAGPQTRRKPEPAYSNRRLGFFFKLARVLNDARLRDALSHCVRRLPAVLAHLRPLPAFRFAPKLSAVSCGHAVA